MIVMATTNNKGEVGTNTSPGTNGYQVRAVVRAVDILELLRTSDGGASLNELAGRSDLAKASIFRMVRTLESTGLIERIPGSDSYRLGVRCLTLGQAYLEQTDLRGEALPTLQRLRQEFDETVHLSVLDDELRVVFLEKLNTTHALGLMSSRIGRTVPSYCTGSGKALLAELDYDPVEVLEANGVLKRHTPSTIYEPDALRRELEQIRAQGYSLDLEEREPGVRCVACPIRAAGGNTVAAVSVSGPTQRLPEHLLQGELADAVRAAAVEISTRLGYTQRRDGLPTA
ncbi:helix-turn-helix domain-containing protein [Rubrobacter tropicus]|uniref:Glycerol operon regulatory protein n=2 Tax=Rubrobacter tropicus TaxID=2653851 RepID=A0A6G8Q4T5_9ACTN|nr:helix-turn-helix domain-containing protein [Rubrobacter tropicus]